MPLDGVCLWSPAVPSSCLGTETSVKDISPAQLGQRSKRSNTWGETTQSHAASASSFPLDTGHMLSLGLQAIFRLAFFFLYRESWFQAFLDILLHTIFMT